MFRGSMFQMTSSFIIKVFLEKSLRGSVSLKSFQTLILYQVVDHRLKNMKYHWGKFVLSFKSHVLYSSHSSVISAVAFVQNSFLFKPSNVMHCLKHTSSSHVSPPHSRGNSSADQTRLQYFRGSSSTLSRPMVQCSK